MSDFPVTSEKGQEMLGFLPSYYETIREFRMLAQTEGVEIDDLTEAIGGILDQSFVDSSTWALDRWEREFGITIDVAKPTDQRRSVIKSKIRGVGTVTATLIKNVAESYDGGTVDVTDHPELYSITIKFISTLGIPPNLNDLKEAIEEILPAHLAVIYTFLYNTYEALSAFTYGELEAFTYEELRSSALS